MDTNVKSQTLLELKYCERCGGLCLRKPDSEIVYCLPCASKLAEYPRPLSRRRPAGHVVTPRLKSYVAKTDGGIA